MNVTLTIPDDLASRILANGPNLGRQALEAFLLENYRARRVSTGELRDLPNLETLDDLDGFLNAHGVYEALHGR